MAEQMGGSSGAQLGRSAGGYVVIFEQSGALTTRVTYPEAAMAVQAAEGLRHWAALASVRVERIGGAGPHPAASEVAGELEAWAGERTGYRRVPCDELRRLAALLREGSAHA